MRKIDKNKIKGIKEIKIILYVVLMVATYLISDKLISFLLTFDAEVLKRGFNLILIVCIVAYVNKKDE